MRAWRSGTTRMGQDQHRRQVRRWGCPESWQSRQKRQVGAWKSVRRPADSGPPRGVGVPAEAAACAAASEPSGRAGEGRMGLLARVDERRDRTRRGKRQGKGEVWGRKGEREWQRTRSGWWGVERGAEERDRARRTWADMTCEARENTQERREGNGGRGKGMDRPVDSSKSSARAACCRDAGKSRFVLAAVSFSSWSRRRDA